MLRELQDTLVQNRAGVSGPYQYCSDFRNAVLSAATNIANNYTPLNGGYQLDGRQFSPKLEPYLSFVFFEHSKPSDYYAGDDYCRLHNYVNDCVNLFLVTFPMYELENCRHSGFREMNTYIVSFKKRSETLISQAEIDKIKTELKTEFLADLRDQIKTNNLEQLLFEEENI